MDDFLISRQAAIDALADYIHNIDKVYSTGKLSAYDCKDAAESVIEQLPSAQPEQRWISCGDCKHYKIDHPRANGYHCCYRMHSIFPMKPDDYCSYGERREDER